MSEEWCSTCGKNTEHETTEEKSLLGIIPRSNKVCSECDQKTGIIDMTGIGISHELTDDCVCPYCGHKQSDFWEVSENKPNSGVSECNECEREFDWESETEIRYTTSMKVEEKE